MGRGTPAPLETTAGRSPHPPEPATEAGSARQVAPSRPPAAAPPVAPATSEAVAAPTPHPARAGPDPGSDPGAGAPPNQARPAPAPRVWPPPACPRPPRAWPVRSRPRAAWTRPARPRPPATRAGPVRWVAWARGPFPGRARTTTAPPSGRLRRRWAPRRRASDQGARRVPVPPPRDLPREVDRVDPQGRSEGRPPTASCWFRRAVRTAAMPVAAGIGRVANRAPARALGGSSERHRNRPDRLPPTGSPRTGNTPTTIWNLEDRGTGPGSDAGPRRRGRPGAPWFRWRRRRASPLVGGAWTPGCAAPPQPAWAQSLAHRSPRPELVNYPHMLARMK
jgi:hypothetical protein